MKFAQLFDNPFFILPKDTPISKSYRRNLFDLFNEYLDLISKVKDYEKLTGVSKKMTLLTMLDRQETFINGIKDSINSYFDGKPYDAYKTLSATIEQRIERNKQMFRIEKYEKGESFYRLRIKEDNFLFQREEMFHIPFESRNKVSTQRYSIPGFPSLYLGKTIYVCWEELNRPDLNIFQACKLTNTKPIEFIDLTPPDISEDIYTAKAFGYIMIWPLIAACSIKVNNSKDIFKPEYIIPQLLLQWVRNTNDVDGIRYNSTHIAHNKIRPAGEYYNLVLPVKSNKETGLCDKLLSYFAISNPISWQLMQMAQGGGHGYMYLQDEFEEIDRKLPDLQIFHGKKYGYGSSILGTMEYFLERMEDVENIDY